LGSFRGDPAAHSLDQRVYFVETGVHFGIALAYLVGRRAMLDGVLELSHGDSEQLEQTAGLIAGDRLTPRIRYYALTAI
jgi:hypothetical protein